MDNNLAYNSFTSFKSLSVDDVWHIIMRSSKKSCPLDPVPTSLVVECIDVLSGSSYCVIVRVSVVLKKTVVGD